MSANGDINYRDLQPKLGRALNERCPLLFPNKFDPGTIQRVDNTLVEAEFEESHAIEIGVTVDFHLPPSYGEKVNNDRLYHSDGWPVPVF